MYSRGLIEDAKIQVANVADRLNISITPISFHYNVVHAPTIVSFVFQDPTEIALHGGRLNTHVSKIDTKYSLHIMNVALPFSNALFDPTVVSSLVNFAMPCAEEPDEIYWSMRKVLSDNAPFSPLLMDIPLDTATAKDAWYRGLRVLLIKSLQHETIKFNTATELLKMYNISLPLHLTNEKNRVIFMHKIVEALDGENLPLGNSKKLFEYYARLIRTFLG